MILDACRRVLQVGVLRASVVGCLAGRRWVGAQPEKLDGKRRGSESGTRDDIDVGHKPNALDGKRRGFPQTARNPHNNKFLLD